MNDINDNIEDEGFGAILDKHLEETEQVGMTIKGIIVKIEDLFFYVDIGSKKEVRMKIEEIKDSYDNLLFKINDEIEFIFSNGVASYKKAIDVKKTKDFIDRLSNDEISSNIDITISKKIKTGYIVSYEEMSFFMPMYLSILKRDKDYVGGKFTVKVIRFDKDTHSIIVSRKDYLKEKTDKFNASLGDIKIGDIVECEVSSLSNYTIKLSVNGTNAIVKFNEISHKGNINPAKVYKVGDKIDAKLVEIEDRRSTLIMSIKQAKEDPWLNINDKYNVGDTIKANVVSIKEYGVFVALDNDIDGFIHISEISWNKERKNINDYVKLDDEFDCKVIEIKPENKNIKLSVKALQERPVEKFAKAFKVNDIIDGEVVAVKDFGAFIKIDFIDGILPNSKASWDKGKKCKDFMKEGEIVKVKIDEIDVKKNKVILNRKSLMPSPIDEFKLKYRVGDAIKGKVKNVVDFGLFISIEDISMDILIPIGECYPKDISDFSEGDEVEAILIRITDKISASIKRLEGKREKDDLAESMANANDDSSITLADMIRKRN